MLKSSKCSPKTFHFDLASDWTKCTVAFCAFKEFYCSVCIISIKIMIIRHAGESKTLCIVNINLLKDFTAVSYAHNTTRFNNKPFSFCLVSFSAVVMAILSLDDLKFTGKWKRPQPGPYRSWNFGPHLAGTFLHCCCVFSC